MAMNSFLMNSSFDWKFNVFKIKFFYKSISTFVIVAGLQSAGCKYLSKHHLKHSVLSIF